MSIATYKAASNSAQAWPTRRLAEIAEANGWTSRTALRSWLQARLPAGAASPAAGGLTTAQGASLVSFFEEIIVAFYELSGKGGEPNGGG